MIPGRTAVKFTCRVLHFDKVFVYDIFCVTASAWSAGISVTDPPKVVFTQEPSDLTICDCADNKEKQLHCRYEWLDAGSATSWNRSLQVRWRKDGNLIPGESGQSLDPLRCADGKHGCAMAAGGVYSCELLVSQPGMSGVLRSRPGRVNVVRKCWDLVSLLSLLSLPCLGSLPCLQSGWRK